jgi:flagellar basal body rod protein FlgG
MVSMMMAQVTFAANAKMMSTTSQVDRRVISLLA